MTSLSDVAFDQQSGALTVSAQVEGLGKQTFAFTGTPQEFRRSAMTSPSAMKAKPVFVVSNAGELSLRAITVEAGGTSARGVPPAGVTSPVQLATVNLPAVAGPAIAQQSGATVDRNQVEQILYRDENEMLRKRLEDLPSKPGIWHRQTRALNIIGIVREFETPYHDMPGHFIGQCVLPVESIFLFFGRLASQPAHSSTDRRSDHTNRRHGHGAWARAVVAA